MAAEFALIVLGVLAALALENWWSGIRDRHSEAEYLADLRAELNLNIESQGQVADLRAQAEASLLRAENILETEQVPDSADIFVVELVRGGTFPTYPRLTTAVFDDLRSSGRLQLIQDATVRREVMEHYARLEANLERLSLLQQDYGSSLAALIAHHVPVRLVTRVPQGLSMAPASGASPSAFRAVAAALAADSALAGEIRAELRTLEGERSLLERLRQLLDEYAAVIGSPASVYGAP
jgi:hypothetical protein